jgi:hypothetical protein
MEIIQGRTAKTHNNTLKNVFEIENRKKPPNPIQSINESGLL